MNSCSICFKEMQPGEIQVLKCKHEFHKTCMDQWSTHSGSKYFVIMNHLQRALIQTTCPLCREDDIREPVYLTQEDKEIDDAHIDYFRKLTTLDDLISMIRNSADEEAETTQ